MAVKKNTEAKKLKELKDVNSKLKKDLKSLQVDYEKLRVESLQASEINQKLSLELKESKDKIENFITPPDFVKDIEIRVVEPINVPALINKKRVIDFLEGKKGDYPEWVEAFTSIVNFIKVRA